MPLLEMLRSKLPSLAWSIGFVAFLVPCAVPGAERRYTSYAFKPGDPGISFYLLILFVGAICLCNWGLVLYRDYHCDKKAMIIALEGDIEKGGSPSVDDDDTYKKQEEEEEEEGNNEEEEEEAEPPVAVPETKAVTTKQRSYFLDNVKVFLTIIVILFHLVIAFGVTRGNWIIQVGNFFSKYYGVLGFFFISPNQGYFMPCFFLISAYFAPRSLAKKGRAVFIKERAERIFIGAVIVTFGLQPLSFYLAAAVAIPRSQNPLGFNMNMVGYNIDPGTTWFLWWLLLFNLWYAFTGATGKQAGTKLPFSRYLQKIPGFAYRWLAGIVICGILQFIVNYFLLGENNEIAAMPNAHGGLTCDLLFFYVGLLAGENQWFAADKPKIRKQIGMNVWLFRALVLAEYVVLGLHPWSNTWPLYNDVTMSETGQSLIAYTIWGIWCVDMSLAVLEFFQSYVDFCNPLSLWLANGAYGAYLLQNITVTLAVAVFVWTYNGNPPLEFEHDPGIVSHTPIPIPTLTTALIYAALVWVPLTWGFAFFFRKMPLLKHVL